MPPLNPNQRPIVLTRDDHAKLKRIIQLIETTPSITGKSRDIVELEHNPNDIYVARTPVGGIPALTEAVGTSLSDDVPGKATCDIYRIIDSGTPELNPLTDVDRAVYNIYHDPIGGNRWIIVLRSKFGKWLATTPWPGPSETDTGTGTGVPSSTSSLEGCRLYNSVDQSLSPNSVTTVNLDSLHYDSSGYADLTNNVITIPIGGAGVYHVGGQIHINDSVGASDWTGRISIGWYNNGQWEEIAAASAVMNNSGPSLITEFWLNCSADIEVSDGDQFRLQAWQNDVGNTHTIKSNGNLWNGLLHTPEIWCHLVGTL